MDAIITKFKCQFCVCTFESRSGLFDHKRKQHPDECSQLYSNFICEIDECHQSFRFLKQYHDHIKLKHPTCDLNFEELNFDSINEFNEWKDSTQSNSISQYILHKPGVKVKKGTLTTYYCNRNGSFKKRGKHGKKLKVQQSRKSTKSCPASMFVLVDATGSCNVHFYSKHLGHDLQLEHVDLTKSEKHRIVDELKSCNLNKDFVLSKLKATGEVTRVNRVDKKELNNIMDQFKLFQKSTIETNSLTTQPMTCDDDTYDADFAKLGQITQYYMDCVNNRKPNHQTLKKMLLKVTEIAKMAEDENETDFICEKIDKRSLECQQQTYNKKIKND